MTIIEKIKAEIERLKTIQLKRIQEGDLVDAEPYDKNEAYNELLDFLTTLEPEKPMNLDDAMKELDEKIALVKQRGTWKGVDVDKYMDEVRGREPGKPMNLEEEINRYLHEECSDDDEPGIHEIAEHFAKWGVEHLATSGKTLEIKPGDEVTINGHKIVYDKDNGYVTIVESPVPNNLEEAAEKSLRLAGFHNMETRGMDWKGGFIAGAEWGAERFAKIVRANLTKIDKSVQSQFEQLYMDLTGDKMYGGYND